MYGSDMRSFVLGFAVLLSMTLLIQAKGTLSGTSVANQADIAYTVGGIANSTTSNADTFVVDRVVDLLVVWEDAAAVEVGAGDVDRALTFRLTNQGNGADTFSLSHEHNATSDFTPQNIKIFRDANGNGHFDAGVDLQITDINLTADANATLFLVGDIPDNNSTTPGKQAHEAIRATSDSVATPGADNPAAVDVVIRKQTDIDEGTLVIRNFWFAAVKSAVLHSEDNLTHTGSRITYTIDTYIDGNATGRTITGVDVIDPIPAGAQYLSGTLKLEGVALSDAVDGDKGDANTTVVHVFVGTLNGTAHQRISFDVQVQ
jgi:uncharacterized repeat protein (TIGR01451 family)